MAPPPCPRMPLSAPATPPPLVSLLSVLHTFSIHMRTFFYLLSISSAPRQCSTCPCLCTIMSCFLLSPSSFTASSAPCLTPLLTGAEHTFAHPLSSPEPELLFLSPFFLLSQSESAFPNSRFPKTDTPFHGAHSHHLCSAYFSLIL